MAERTKKQHPRSKAPKYPNITADAAALGVSRNHLFLVLEGRRPSRRLMGAYLKLQKPAA